MMSQQERTDIARDAIHSRLNKAIMNNYNDLIGGMKYIQDIDLDISRTAVQIGNTLRKVRMVKNTFATIGITIAAKRRRRERLVQVKEKLQWLHSLCTAQQDIDEACADYNFSSAMKKLNQSQKRLQDSALRKYSVLGNIRARLLSENAWPEIRKQLDSSLRFLVKDWSMADPLPQSSYRALSEFNSSESDPICSDESHINLPEFQRRFNNIVSGYDELDRITKPTELESAVNQINQLRHSSDIRDDSVWAQCSEQRKTMTQLEMLPAKLQNCLISSIASATKSALVNVVLEVRGITKRTCEALYRKYGIMEQGEQQQSWNDILEEYANEEARLKQLRYSELCTELSQCMTHQSSAPEEPKLFSSRGSNKISYDSVRCSKTTSPYEAGVQELSSEGILVRAVTTVVSAITSVLHCHYIILQTMRTPFDARNTSWEYIHRCGIEEEDQVKERHLGDKSMQQLVDQVRKMRELSLDSREAVWRAAQSQVGALVLSVVGSCGIETPEGGLTRCLAVAFDFMHVGAEYLGVATVPKNAPDGEDSAHSETGVSSWKLWKVVASCEKLRESLHLACSHLIDFTRTQSLSKLRTLLSRDSWQSSPGTAEQHCALLTDIGTSCPGLCYTTDKNNGHIGGMREAVGAFLVERARRKPNEEAIAAPLPGEAIHCCDSTRYVDYMLCAATVASTEGLLAGRLNQSLMMDTLGYELDIDLNGDARCIVPTLSDVLDAKNPEFIAAQFGLPAFSHNAARRFQDSDLNHISSYPSRSSEDDKLRAAFTSLAVLASSDASRFQLGYVCPQWIRGRVFSMYGLWDEFHEPIKKRLLHCLSGSDGFITTERTLEDLQLPSSNPFGRFKNGKVFLEVVLFSLQEATLSSERLLEVCPFKPDQLRTEKHTTSSSTANETLKRRGTVDQPEEKFSSSSDSSHGEESESDESEEDRDSNRIEGFKLDEVPGPAMRSPFCNIVNMILSPEVQQYFDPKQPSSSSVISGQFSLAATSVVVHGIFEALRRYVSLARCLPGVGIEIWKAIADLINLYICALTTSMVDSTILTEIIESQGARMNKVIDYAISSRKNAQFHNFDSADIPKSLLEKIDETPHFDEASFRTSLRTAAASVTATGLHAILLDSKCNQGEKRQHLPNVSFATLVQMTSSRMFTHKRNSRREGKKGSNRDEVCRDLRDFVTESTSHELYKSQVNQKFEAFAPILGDTGIDELANLLLETGSDPSLFPLLTLRDLVLSSIDALQEQGEKLDGTGSSSSDAAAGSKQSRKSGASHNERILSPVKSRHENYKSKGASSKETAKTVLESIRESLHTQAKSPGRCFRLSVNPGAVGSQSTFIRSQSIASESLIFVLCLLSAAKKWLKMAIPSAGQENLHSWYSKVVTAVVQLRAVLLSSTSQKLMSNLETLPEKISAEKWDSISDLSEIEHSKYVKSFVSEMKEARRLLDVSCGRMGAIVSSTTGKVASSSILTSEAIINDRLMLGFMRGVGRVPNCTHEGRGLMTMDVDALYHAANQSFHFPQQHSIRTKDQVGSYIKAYYFEREEDTTAWIRENKLKYPYDALIGLLTNGPAAAEMRKAGSLSKRKDECADYYTDRIAGELNETLGLST